VIHRDTVRAKAWESAVRPDLWHPVAALIDVATRAETPEEGRRNLRIFAEMYTDTVTKACRDTARKLREEREYD
jgi:hypothetical protein